MKRQPLRRLTAAGLLASTISCALPGIAADLAELPETCYVFSYFIGNGEDGLHLAWSRDGLKWEALNEGRSYLTPVVGKSKLMRDPCITQGPDGTYHMVWTDSWDSRTIGYASSKDLLRWSRQRTIPVMEHAPTAKNCWAPEIVYDADRECFLIFWATTIPGAFPAAASAGKDDNNHRIYATTTRDFETFTPTELFFEPGFNVIDSTLLARDGAVYMVFKDERKVPQAMKNLRLAVAERLAGPYQVREEPINPPGAWVEGPTTLRIGDDTYLYFDAYTRHEYAALRSRDLKTWEDISSQISFPRGTRHGTALAVPRAVVQNLMRAANDPAGRILIETGAAGIPVSPVMHGVFFEDINYGADGGLYAELVQNRSFEDADPLHAWTAINPDAAGRVEVLTGGGLHTNNPHFLRVHIGDAGTGAGVSNAGYDGIPVRQGETYRFSVLARGAGGSLHAILEDDAGQEIGACRIGDLRERWERYEGTIEALGSTARARLNVLATGANPVDLDLVSLFPVNTWNQRPNGLRADLVQLLADMKPGFMRFPGGCIVEGKDLANAYRWKDTIGDIGRRPQNWNRWQDAVSTKAPHYYQSYGLGFYEYFQLCEDLGAAPVPILNCGMSCQYQDKELVPLDELDPWVQDALDLIEFANGPADSAWGAVRARMGHPAPFGMTYLGIGNEQWGEAYFERYQVFYDAIKARYPEMVLITTSGPGVDDRWWNLAWEKFTSGTPADLVDEHYYRPPQWFLENVDRYAGYDRNGPKVFAGEFAAHDRGRRNNLRCAIAEAAYMTGLLRNADVVTMSAYAPLFAREGFSQWRPDLIWFDGTRAYGSPSYHVQAMFSRNRPDHVLPVRLTPPAPAPIVASGRIGVGTWNTQAEFKDIRVTHDGKTLFESNFAAGHDGWQTTRGEWSVSDGALRQNRIEGDVTAVAGEPEWTDYTYSLKARKLAGQEGFMVLFQVGADDARSWWNLGGWGNAEHGFRGPGLPDTRIPGRIETGRWYDIRVELRGPTVKCYLDGELVQEATRRLPPTLHTVAGRDQHTGEIVLTVVNTSAQPVEAEIGLEGVAAVAPQARAIVLTADSPDDENSRAEPNRVSPRVEEIPLSGPDFRRAFPANSVTILRVSPTG